jgi:hypothetical protein
MGGYMERHHVIPRCMGGSDEETNLVLLTPEEHLIAHLLLVKINPEHRGVAYAACMMSSAVSNNKAYGWVRRRASAARIGSRHTEEARKKISANHPWRGKTRPPYSSEARARMSAGQRGRKHPPEVIAKISAALRGNKYKSGKANPPEDLARRSEAMRGNKYRLGKPHSPESKAKMAAAREVRNRGIL